MAQIGLDLGFTGNIIEFKPEISYITSDTRYRSHCISNRNGISNCLCRASNLYCRFGCIIRNRFRFDNDREDQHDLLFEEPLAETIIRADNGYIVITNSGRFVIVGAGRDIKNLMNTVKIFRIANARQGDFPVPE